MSDSIDELMGSESKEEKADQTNAFVQEVMSYMEGMVADFSAVVNAIESRVDLLEKQMVYLLSKDPKWAKRFDEMREAYDKERAQKEEAEDEK